ncbi:MAG: NAD(+) synthase [Burkholderiales bacterium 66-5]|uniref:ammonia-dependent NAD(+) synthetase n=1 Tax=Comamonas badia TaxID=265291 RepID=UPI00040C1838|nr:ammonia-dependent NAD(+) synthetase [Comamonas badia]OJU87336.1 MAG: NAD(+) synthase [Burkholderiales bacterium 66-5]
MSRQTEIAAALQVVPPFADEAALAAECQRRIAFIRATLQSSGLRTLVLGISGGVDSLTAGRMAQLAVEQLRAETGDAAYRFIAVRLPYAVQFDEPDAQAALAFVRADEEITVPIEPGVTALAVPIAALQALPDAQRDFALGNIKARCRMVVQYAVANAHRGLVIGTDHAAEAVMGFFTKFGDGACDLVPLNGLVKGQIRAIATHLGAPAHLVNKVPTGDLESLKPGKPDEVAYGVSYAEIDAFLQGGTVSPEAAARIIATYDASQHKRSLPLAP